MNDLLSPTAWSRRSSSRTWLGPSPGAWSPCRRRGRNRRQHRPSPTPPPTAGPRQPPSRQRPPPWPRPPGSSAGAASTRRWPPLTLPATQKSVSIPVP